jgi:hypothetical protein
MVFSCKKPEAIKNMDYNEKANELIGQIISRDSCDCILEFSNGSIVDYYKQIQPSFNFRKSLQVTLKTQNLKTLDSLVALSNNFKLDSTILRGINKNVKVITQKQLIEFGKDTTLEVYKICPRSILIIQKPVFNKDFNIAAVHQGYPFGCDGGLTLTYEYKNKKWISELDKTAATTR